jgi:hypothetical protein
MKRDLGGKFISYDLSTSKVLRSVTKEPWYVSNFTLHNDLQILYVIEIHRLSTLYYQSILGHNNGLVAEISNPQNVRIRLMRQCPKTKIKATTIPLQSLSDYHQ